MPPAIPARPREKISAIVTTFNEEREIADCIRSLLWCDEILIVDSFSTDRTVEIVRSFPAHVKLLQHTYFGSAAQKNWAMDRTSHKWILIFDADERCTPELRQEIETLLERGAELTSYSIRRRLFFLDRHIRFSGFQRAGEACTRSMVKRATISSRLMISVLSSKLQPCSARKLNIASGR